MWSKARTYLLCVFSGTGAVQGTIQQPQTIMYLFFYSIKDLSADNTSGLPITGKKVASISLIKIIIIITDHNLDLQESSARCVFAHPYAFLVGVVEDRSVLMGLPDGSHGPNGSCGTIVV